MEIDEAFDIAVEDVLPCLPALRDVVRNAGGYNLGEAAVRRVVRTGSEFLRIRSVPGFSDAGPLAPGEDSGNAFSGPAVPTCFSIELFAGFLYNIDEMPVQGPVGEFEQIVILAILRLGDQAYGVSIRAEIAACTDREPTHGALYTTLDRLEDKGYVTSRLGEPTPQRGGRAKRYFTVTATGVEAVTRAQRAYQRLLKGLMLPRVTHA